MKKSETKKIALAAVLAALACVLVFIGTVFDLFNLAASAAASLVVALAVIELKGKYPFLIYLTTSALSLILMPMSAATLYFVFFFGYYPLLKFVLSKKNKVLAWVVKLSAANTAMILFIVFFRSIFGIEETGAALLYFTLLPFNVFFVAFDFLLSMLTTLYLVKLRHFLHFDHLF